MNLFLRTYFLFFLPFTFLITACQSTTDKKNTPPTEIHHLTIDTLYTFTTFEKQNIAKPTDVEILENGHILVSDYSTNKITAMDKTGEVKFVFGREGRGPGEFLNIRDVFELDNQIMVFDNHLYKISAFDFQGQFLQSHTFPSDAFNNELSMVNDSLYIIGTQGLKDSLFQIQSLTSDSILRFEEPRIRRYGRSNMKKNQNQLKAGQIPDIFKNMVIIKSDSKHIYVFFEGFSELAKYDLLGNLLWNKNIDLPFNKEIFNRVVEQVKKETSTRSISKVKYIVDFNLYEEGTFILTSSSDKSTQQLVKLDHSGEIRAIYTLLNSPTVYHFDIDFKNKVAYFTSWNYEVVGKAKL